jgi:tetratricopeptide (TPR) repeat protein
MGSHMMMLLGTLRRIGFTAFTVFALLFVVTPAWADDPLAKPKNATAQQRLAAGNKLYRVREFEKAVEEYKAGALVEDVPVFHYNLGQCFRQLGRYEDAIWHYERFIERGQPTGPMRGAVDAFLTQMRSELEKKAMSQRPIDPAPEPKPVPDPPKTTTIRIPGEPWHKDRLGWGLGAAGVVSIGVSSWLLISANGLDDDSNKQATQAERQDLRDRASSRRTIGAIVGIGGAGLLVGGIIKLALRPADREETVTTSLNVGITGDGVFVTGRF